MSNPNSIIAADAKAAELDATRAVYDMLKPLGCEAQTRVLDHVYGLLRAHRQSSEAQEQDEISSRVKFLWRERAAPGPHKPSREDPA